MWVLCAAWVTTPSQLELRALGGVVDEVPDLERALEVLGGLHEGEDLLGLQPGAHVRGQRLGHPVRRAPVQRELGRRRPVGQAGVVAQGLGQREVQRGPLAGEQVGVRGLLQQRVAERVAVGVLDEHVLGQGLAQRLHQGGLRQPGDGREQAMARAPAGRGGHAQHAARVVGQCLQAQVEDVAQVRRQRPGRGVRCREQLLGEEGVALAARVQARDEVRCRGVAEDARHLLGELGL